MCFDSQRQMSHLSIGCSVLGCYQIALMILLGWIRKRPGVEESKDGGTHMLDFGILLLCELCVAAQLSAGTVLLKHKSNYSQKARR